MSQAEELNIDYLVQMKKDRVLSRDITPVSQRLAKRSDSKEALLLGGVLILVLGVLYYMFFWYIGEKQILKQRNTMI